MLLSVCITQLSTGSRYLQPRGRNIEFLMVRVLQRSIITIYSNDLLSHIFSLSSRG